jgi:uncharacterized membrane protein YidH (DUF202 family)
MGESSEQEILAKLRTVFALERNLLAEERTALAEFRTGLTLAIIAPTSSTVIAYIFTLILVEEMVLVDLINFTFFALLTAMGIWISVKSHSKLKKTRKKLSALKKKVTEIVESSEEIHDFFIHCIDAE